MFSIRSFQPTEADYEAMAQVEKAVYPENAETVEDFKHGDAIRQPEQFFHRWLVEQNGRVIAFGHVSQPPQFSDPGRYRFNIIVHPDFERRGVGTAVYHQIQQTLQSRTPTPTILETGCYRHHSQAASFLQSRGFTQTMCWVITKLDVQAFDARPYDALFTILAAQGIKIVSLPQLQQQDARWLEKIYQLATTLMQDVPLPYAAKDISLDYFRKRIVEAPTVIPEAWLVALEQEEVIGDSALEKSSQPDTLSTGFTGVLRAHRQHGLATALKVRAIEYAKESGYRFIRTGNEENNPMLTLNKKLGFEEITARLAFARHL